jgi:hypothetical protein
MALKKLLLPALGLAAIAGGGAFAYNQFFKGVSTADSSPLAIAKFVPENAYAIAHLSTDPQTWAKLERFGTPEAQTLVKQRIQELQQTVLKDTQIDYDKDLKPWVGDMAIAFLPNTSNLPNQTNSLMVVGIKNKVNAAAFASKLASATVGKTKQTDYNGVSISSTANDRLHTAIVKDHLILSADQTTVQQAIDTLKGKPSLANKSGASEVLSHKTDLKDPIARLYVIDYATAVQQMASRSSSNALPATTLEQAKQVKSFVGGIGADPVGLRAKAIIDFNPQLYKGFDFKPTPGKIIARFPSDTMALISGSGISQIWSQALAQANETPELQKSLEQLRELPSAIGLDLTKDVFSWMNGEFAIALLPADQGVLAPVGFSGMVIVETSDRSTAEATLNKLDNLARGNVVRVGQRDTDGKSVTEWSVPQGAILSHGWLDQKTVFLTLGSSADSATKRSTTLDTNELFKTTTGSLPKDNTGYFFVDMEKAMAIANRNSLASSKQPLPTETKAILESIRGIGVTSTQSNNKASSNLEMLWTLKSATK